MMTMSLLLTMIGFMMLIVVPLGLEVSKAQSGSQSNLYLGVDFRRHSASFQGSLGV